MHVEMKQFNPNFIAKIILQVKILHVKNIYISHKVQDLVLNNNNKEYNK